MIEQRDILKERVGGGFVFVPMIDISQTGWDGIRSEVQEGTFAHHI